VNGAGRKDENVALLPISDVIADHSVVLVRLTI
jgi:hypothetical protein